MTSLARLTLCALILVALTVGANASVLTWYLNGVVFNDGGTATGSFNFDPDAGTPCSTGATPCGIFSNVQITTTTGSVRTGAAYAFVCGDGAAFPMYDPSCTGASPNSTEVLTLTTVASNQTGLPGLALFFTGVGAVPPAGLTDYSGTIDISNSSLAVGAMLEGTCMDAPCSTPAAPTRSSVSGVVGSSETLEQYFFFGG